MLSLIVYGIPNEIVQVEIPEIRLEGTALEEYLAIRAFEDNLALSPIGDL